MEQDFGKALANVVEDIVKRADEERLKEEPYKELFKAGQEGIPHLLWEANHQMVHIALNMAKIIKDQHGIRISNHLWDMIRAIPIALDNLQDEIQDKEGNSCCGDKARFIYADRILAEIEKIKGNHAK